VPLFQAVKPIALLKRNYKERTKSQFLIISSLLLFCRKITLVNKDAKFKGVFKRKSIKDVESIDCSGFWIFNSVSIYGRGGNKISLSFVADFNNVRNYAENIEKWN